MITKGLYQTQYRSIDGKSTILLFKRNEDGTKTVDRVTDFEPYFYIEQDYMEAIKGKLMSPDVTVHKTVFGKNALKVTTRSPYDIYQIKKEVDYTRIYEADIPYDLRYMIDVVETNEPTKYKVLTFDIETDCSSGFPKKENPIEPIICITMHDNYSDEEHTYVWRSDLESSTKSSSKHIIHYFNDEKTMLRLFLIQWQNTDPDIVTAWNLGFDIGYLIARMEYLGLSTKRLSCVTDNIYRGVVNILPRGDIEIVGLVLFDALTAYKKMHFGELSSYSLNSIAADELGEQKEGVHNTGQVWREDIDALISYNRKDVELVVKIVNKTKLISIFEDIKNFAGVRNLNDCFSASRIHETKIMKKYKGKCVFPTKPPFKEFDEDDEREEIEGATVLAPTPGLYNNVIVGDFKSLYPSAIKSFNLSKEKIRDEPSDTTITVGGVHYDMDSVGIMPSMIEELTNLKDEMKIKVAGTGQDISDKMFAIKTFINSFYGINLLRSFRLFDIRVGSTITYIGRYFHEKCVSYVHANYPHAKVVYGDTDSIFIQLQGFDTNEEVVEEGRTIIKALNNEVQRVLNEDFHIRSNNMKIEFEKVFKTVILFKKKRYAGNIIYEDEFVDKIKIAGVAARRSDTSRISKKMQKELITMILRGAHKGEATDYVLMVANDMVNRKIPLEDVAIPIKYNEDPSTYAIQNTPKIRAAKHKRETTGVSVGAGQKVLMLYVKHPNTSVICFEDIQEVNGYEVDYQQMIDKNILQKIKSVYTTLGWNDYYYKIEIACNMLCTKQKSLLNTWM